MQTLTGKVALITGAARGMGRNHAVRLAEEGAAIIAVDICATVAGISYPMATADDLAETERLVRARGSKIASAQVDIRDSHALQAAIDRAVAELGGLHIVVANAGVLALARSEEFTQPQWDAVISVNLTGTWNTIRAAVPHLTTCGGGSIIAIASAAGLVGLPLNAWESAERRATVVPNIFGRGHSPLSLPDMYLDPVASSFSQIGCDGIPRPSGKETVRPEAVTGEQFSEDIIS